MNLKLKLSILISLNQLELVTLYKNEIEHPQTCNGVVMIRGVRKRLQKISLVFKRVANLPLKVLEARNKVVEGALGIRVLEHAAGRDLKPAVLQLGRAPGTLLLHRQNLQPEGAEEQLGRPLPAAGEVAPQQGFHTVGYALIGDALLSVEVVGYGLLPDIRATVFLGWVPEADHEVVLLARFAGVKVAHGVPGTVVELVSATVWDEMGVVGFLGCFPLVPGLGRLERDFLPEGS